MPSDPIENSTIAELLARDPFKLTQLDLDQIITYYREKRLLFKQTGKGAPRAEKARPSLDDLGL